MATISFIVKSRPGRLAPIFLRLRHGRPIDLTISTEFRVFPEYWSNTAQGIKQRIAFTDSFSEKDRANLEDQLLDFKTYVFKLVNTRLIGKETISREWLEKTVQQYFQREDVVNLTSYIDQFVKQIKSGERTFQKGDGGGEMKYNPSTVRSFEGFKQQFDHFQKEYGKVNFEHITMEFYNKYVKFFLKKNYSPNTIGRHVKHLKTIMREAAKEKLHTNTEFVNKDFKVYRKEIENVYLTEIELEKMFNLELPPGPMNLARDVFLIGCYTAQRFSDYSRIRYENIVTLENGATALTLIQKKTGERVTIPMQPRLTLLLAKYDFNVPKIYEQKLNVNIKKVAALAKITEPITIEEIRGGLKVSKTVPKCNLVKSHTARRSGCTNLYLAGIQPLDIMKLSGHRTETEFLKYINVTKDQTAMNLSNHVYFNRPVLKISTK